MTELGSEFMPILQNHQQQHIGLNFTLKQMSTAITVNIYFASTSRNVVEKDEKILTFELLANVGGQLGEVWHV